MNDFYQFDQNFYSGVTRSQRLKVRRLNKRRLFLRLFLIVAILATAIYGGFTYGEEARAFLAEKISGTFAKEEEKDLAGIVSKEEERDPQRNILILGVDQRENEPSRSDTIMVLMLNPETKKAHFMSLPRDSRVEIEGYSYKTKLNHAHANGGMDLAKKTIENLLDIKIHNTVETNFTGFENIIDLLGGVEMEVEKKMYYPAEDINIKKGFQKLDGHDALGYVRYRSDGKGDLGRIERQQNFLKALIEQHLRFGTLIKLPDIMGELKENIQTDLSVTELLALGKSFRDMDAAGVQFHQLPGEPEYLNGASYYMVNAEELQQLIGEITDDLKREEVSIDTTTD